MMGKEAVETKEKSQDKTGKMTKYISFKEFIHKIIIPKVIPFRIFIEKNGFYNCPKIKKKIIKFL